MEVLEEVELRSMIDVKVLVAGVLLEVALVLVLLEV